MILKEMKVRSDSMGNGQFGAGRGGRKHNGTDYVVKEGDEIYSPFDGTITKLNYPYAGDTKYRGVTVVSNGTEIKIFYCKAAPGIKVNTKVTKGQVIAHAQDISKKYSDKMIPHVHVEVRKNGSILNPQKFFDTFEQV